MVVKPPGDAGRVFEVDDGVLGGSVGVGVEFGIVEERTGSVDEAVVLIVSGNALGRGDALAVEASEEGGGACAVETFVVIEDANEQERLPFAGHDLWGRQGG